MTQPKYEARQLTEAENAGRARRGYALESMQGEIVILNHETKEAYPFGPPITMADLEAIIPKLTGGKVPNLFLASQDAGLYAALTAGA